MPRRAIESIEGEIKSLARRLDETPRSGGDAEVSTGKNLFMRAAQGISAFAQALGIKLVAGRGNVTVEAQQGAVEGFHALQSRTHGRRGRLGGFAGTTGEQNQQDDAGGHGQGRETRHALDSC